MCVPFASDGNANLASPDLQTVQTGHDFFRRATSFRARARFHSGHALTPPLFAIETCARNRESGACNAVFLARCRTLRSTVSPRAASILSSLPLPSRKTPPAVAAHSVLTVEIERADFRCRSEKSRSTSARSSARKVGRAPPRRAALKSRHEAAAKPKNRSGRTAMRSKRKHNL